MPSQPSPALRSAATTLPEHEGGIDPRPALVLFSGGQDSTTCLAWALSHHAWVETVGFDYGQRHRAELEQRPILRARIAALLPSWGGRLGPDHMLDLPVLGGIGGSALTEQRAIALQENGLPNTFVPGRNLAFLVLSAALAYRRSIRVLVGGMCETDYSGYPDCRDATIKAQQTALALGLAEQIEILTPLMWSDKARIWALAEELGGPGLVELIVEHSHTCYLGVRDQRHEWGYGCGACPACELRAGGWSRWRQA